MERLGVDYIDCHSVGTIVHVAVDGKYAGHILICDMIKPHAKEAIQALRKSGIKKDDYADRRLQADSRSGSCRSWN